MKRPARRVFQMPPATTPETNAAPDVAAVYEDMRRFRAEIEQARRIIMATVSQLSSNVDRLIDAAMKIKNERDTTAGQPVTSQPQDDPALDELNSRIEQAINVLSGASGQPARVPEPQPDPTTRPDPVDPNAPMIP